MIIMPPFTYIDSKQDRTAYDTHRINIRIFRILTLAFIASILIFTSCTETNNQLLSEASSLVMTHPDSAVYLLNSIDRSQLNKEQQALQSLLRIKAIVKSSAKVNSDTTLLDMVNFYRNRGDSLEIQSLYYYGRANRERINDPKTLSAFVACFDLAKLYGDSLYAGLAARNISQIYDELLLGKEQINWANIEKGYFAKNSYATYAAWADLDRIRAYARNDMPNEALEIIENVDSNLYHSNRDFRVLINANKAIALHNLNNYVEVIDILHRQIKDSVPLNSGQWHLLSDCYLETGNLEAAITSNDSALFLSSTNRDSIRVALMYSKISARNGDYRKAWETYHNFTSRLLNETEAIRDQSILIALNKTIRDNLILEKALSKNLSQRNTVLMIIIILMIISMVLIILSFLAYKRLKERKMEITEIMTETVYKEATEINEDISNLLSPQLSLLNQLFLRLYDNSSIIKMKATEKQSNEIIAQLRSDQTFKDMEVWINENNNRWMDKFDSFFPNLSKSYRHLVILLYLGFTPPSIAFLTDRDSIKAVHTAKSRLKSKLSLSDDKEIMNILCRLGLLKD